jgi:hypothetical protein
MAICQVLQPILGCNGLFVMQLARGMRKPVRDHIQFGLMGRAERLRRVGSSAPSSPFPYQLPYRNQPLLSGHGSFWARGGAELVVFRLLRQRGRRCLAHLAIWHLAHSTKSTGSESATDKQAGATLRLFVRTHWVPRTVKSMMISYRTRRVRGTRSAGTRVWIAE